MIICLPTHGTTEVQRIDHYIDVGTQRKGGEELNVADRSLRRERKKCDVQQDVPFLSSVMAPTSFQRPLSANMAAQGRSAGASAFTARCDTFSRDRLSDGKD